MSKAALCSLVLHVGTFAASYYWCSQALTQFTTAGARRAIHLEASLVENTSPEPLEELDQDRRRSTIKPQQPKVVENDLALSAAGATIAKHEALVMAERPESPDVLAQHLKVDPSPAATAAEARTQTERDDAVSLRDVATLRPPIRAARELPLLAVVTALQIAGVDDTRPPDFSNNRPPSYPPEAIRQRIEGTVILRLHISAAGSVEEVEVSQSSGHAILDREAVAAVSGWRGSPATRAGRAVETIELLPIRFRLD